MGYALVTSNVSNGISIDSTLRSYVYLGKVAIPEYNDTGANKFDITFGCAGYPLVFVQLPYALTGSGDAAGLQVGNQGMPLTQRYGVAMVALRSAGTNTWTATVISNRPTDGGYTTPLGFFIRIFGRLDLNYPGGSDDPLTARSWADDGSNALIFDGGYRMLKLAGATYAAEALLEERYPGYDAYTDLVNKYDTSQDLGFDLSGKSICANARTSLFPPYEYGSYVDFDTNQIVHQTVIQYINSLYWANGSTLYVRKVSYNYRYQEFFGAYASGYSGLQPTKTRVAIIDNSKFP